MPWAQAVLSSRPDSHAFQERRLSLAEAVRVGRSVARWRAAANNATFDCKVLSRHHARLWYSDGKFLLQDTHSSNGTFVNGQRLGKSGEESAPFQIYSGDVLQFGVDVTENARKVTHSCIIAMVKLQLPDGTEYKHRPEVDSVSVKSEGNSTLLKPQDLHQLSRYLQEALYREQLLHKKLSALQTLLQSARRASDDGWQALIIEDKLLSRLETLENRLMAYSNSKQSLSDECLRKELELLQCDKGRYETAAKEALRRALQDKVEAHEKLASAQCALRCSDEELVHLQAAQEASQAEINELTAQTERAAKRVAQLEEQLQTALSESALKDESSQDELERRLVAMETHESALLTRIEQLTTENDHTRDLLAQAHELLKNGGRYPRDGDGDGEETETETEGDAEPSPDRRDKEECLSTILEEPEDLRGYSQDGEAGTARGPAQEDSSVVSFSAREVLLELLSAQQREDSDAEAGGEPTSCPPWLRPGPGEEGEGPAEPAVVRARLADTQEIERIFTARCGELEAMLEEEREASTRQADVSSKSIQNLQAQLVSLREELESLRREKESELQEARRELTQVLDQARTLRHVLEDTATERENDIAVLQEELGRLRAELSRQQHDKSHSPRPRGPEHGFADSTRLRGHVERLEGECHGLRAECEELQRERDSLREQLHGLHKEIQSARVEEQELQEVVSGLRASRDFLASRRSAGPAAEEARAGGSRGDNDDVVGGNRPGDGAEGRPRAEGEAAEVGNGSEAGGGDLQTQLQQAESVAESLQKKCVEAQLELEALQERHQATERETRSLHDELELCREKLERYRKVKQKAWAGWLPLMAMVVGIAVSVLYPTME